MNTTVDTTNGVGHRQTTSESFSQSYFYEELTRFRQHIGSDSFWKLTEDQRDIHVKALGFVYLNVVPDDNAQVTPELTKQWADHFMNTIAEYNRRDVMLSLYPKRNAPNCPICQRNNGVSKGTDGIWRCHMVNHLTPVICEPLMLTN